MHVVIGRVEKVNLSSVIGPGSRKGCSSSFEFLVMPFRENQNRVWSIYHEHEQSMNHNQSYCCKQSILAMVDPFFNWLGAHVLLSLKE